MKMASLTSEQRQRIEQNRLRALQLRAKKDCKQFISSNSASASAASRVPQSFVKGTSNGVQQSELKQNTNKSIGVVDLPSKTGQFKASSDISKASSSVSSATGPKNLSALCSNSTQVVTSSSEVTSSTRVTPVSFSSTKPVSQFYKKTVSSGKSSGVNSKNESLKATPHFQTHNLNSDRPRNQHGAAVFSSRNVNATSSNFHFQKQSGNTISSKQSSTLMFGSKKSLSASCHLISKDRFLVEVPFQQNVVEIFQKMKSKCYDVNGRKWTFGVSEYTDLIKQLRSLQPPVDVKPLPSPVVKLFCTSSKPLPIQEANLISVDQILTDNLMPFQRDGVNFVIHHGGRALIADDMGLGKTIQAICVACYYRTEWPLLVVSPSSMRYSWAEAFQKWVPSLDPDEIHVVTTGQKEMGSRLVNIISYDLMSRKAQQLAAKKYQIVIMDESHFLKNYKTARTKAAIPILKNAPRRLLLSGTPALSRPSELYMQIQVLHTSMFPSFHEFGIRYCDAKQNPWGWDYSGSSNLTELQLLLERKIMIRRLKCDVLSQLPAKTRQKVIMDPKTIKIKSSSFKSLAAAARKETANREMILEYYAETAKMKMSAVRTYVEDLLESDKKFLVFAHHQNMMETLCEACQSKKVQFIRIDGSTPPQQRFKFCEDFQTKDECRVAVLSIMAANSGITLTAASLVVFAELFWNPGILMQAEDRAHRIGQSDAVFIHYLIAKGTADDHLWPLVQRKLRILEKAGLSKNDFSEADTKVMKDPTQQSILNFLEQSFAEEFTQEELQVLEDATDVSSSSVIGENYDCREEEHGGESGGRSGKESCRTLNSLWSTTNKEAVTPPMKKTKSSPLKITQSKSASHAHLDEEII